MNVLWSCRVFCKAERTQLRNKERALSILRSKLFEMQQEEQRAKIASQRKSQIGTGSRSEKIKTYNYKDARVSDHRLKNNYPLDSMLQGSALEQNVQVSSISPPLNMHLLSPAGLLQVFSSQSVDADTSRVPVSRM
ncbi:MAG: hypothetical protein HC767_02520 [Akkermansiaceae bacterium]|nr:hypothetical protein [Akkermansiaceae bacterium]